MGSSGIKAVITFPLNTLGQRVKMTSSHPIQQQRAIPVNMITYFIFIPELLSILL